MLVFLTGATGFVGSHVARVLVAQGADLRLLVRSGSDLRNIQELQSERVVGDLRDAASLKKAVAGCEVVFHVAADYRLWVRDPAQMYRSNVEGTKAILEAARESKVRRVVYTSSVATMGFQSNGHLASEDSPVSLANMIGPYKRSKFMAEEIAIQAGKSGMDVVVVNPTTPVGERDLKPTAERKTIDRNDQRDGKVGKRGDEHAILANKSRDVFFWPRKDGGELKNIRANNERILSAGDQHAFYRGFCLDRIYGAAQFIECQSIELVDGFISTVEAQLGDSAIWDFNFDRLTFEKHGTDPCITLICGSAAG